MKKKRAAPETAAPPALPTPRAAKAPETYRTLSLIGLAFSVYYLASLFITFLCTLLLTLFAPDLLDAWWSSWVLSLFTAYILPLPILWLFFRKVPVSPHNKDHALSRTASLDKPPFYLGDQLILLFIALGCVTLGGLLDAGTVLLHAVIVDLLFDPAPVAPVTADPLWSQFLFLCVLAPLCDGLIFFKLMIDRTRRYGDLFSILLSGILFALYCGDLYHFFRTALVGLLLAYVYTRTGQFWRCVVIHAAVNLADGIVIPLLVSLLPEGLTGLTDVLRHPLAVAILLGQLAMLAAGGVLFFRLFPKRKLSNGSTPIYRERALSAVLGAHGMIPCLFTPLAFMTLALFIA